MRKNPKARKFARRLLDICKDGDGRLVPAEVEKALAALRANPPRDYRAILRSLAFLAEREIAASTARVAAGAPLAEESLAKIESEFNRKYGRSLAVEKQVDPELLAGIRVQVGDDLYEISIPGRLAALGASRR